MNIILGEENVKEIDQKYTVLELDTLLFSGSATPVTAYCLVEKVGLEEFVTLDRFRELHNNMMKNYRLKNWKYCEDALEHLMGKWRGELNSFYDDVAIRIKEYKQADPGKDWAGVIEKKISF